MKPSEIREGCAYYNLNCSQSTLVGPFHVLRIYMRDDGQQCVEFARGSISGHPQELPLREFAERMEKEYL